MFIVNKVETSRDLWWRLSQEHMFEGDLVLRDSAKIYSAPLPLGATNSSEGRIKHYLDILKVCEHDNQVELGVMSSHTENEGFTMLEESTKLHRDTLAFEDFSRQYEGW